MKKIILSLLMLCCMTAAWAEGTGDGSKDKPFEGVWTVSEMAAKLKAGNYLACGCEIRGGNITVTDSKLNEKVAASLARWMVGEMIGGAIWAPYSSYCFYNGELSERWKQKFFVTSVDTVRLSTEMLWLKIKGHYTGQYTGAGAGSSVNPYSGKWHAADFAKTIKVGSRLAYDCVVYDSDIKVIDTKLGNKEVVSANESWAVSDAIDDSPYDAYEGYCSFNSDLANRQKQMFVVTGLKPGDQTDENPCMEISGYYTGLYSRGDGSAEHPFAGVWKFYELFPKLKEGNHLDYSCVIDGGELFVYDDKLDATIVHSNFYDKWVVSDAIDDTPTEDFADYCLHNGRENRKHHTFVITKVEKENMGEMDRCNITGHYSGAYENSRPGYIDVGDEYAFKKVITLDNAAKVQLKADIDISALGTICDTFKGSINGLDTNYVDPDTGEQHEMMFTIYGGREDGKTRTPMFKETRGAKFENIFFHSFNLHDNDKGNFGIIANEVYSTEFTNITFNKVKIFSDKDYIGCVAGKAYDHCKFNKVLISSCALNNDGRWGGGLVGYSEDSEYTDCLFNMGSSIFVDGTLLTTYAGAFSGGFVGQSKRDKFTNCINMGIVSGNEDSVGGITGRSTGSTFTDCQNTGMVFHCNEDEYSEVCADVDKYIKDNADLLEAQIADMDMDADLEDLSIGSTALTLGAIAAGGLGGFVGYGIGHGLAYGFLYFASGTTRAWLLLSEWSGLATNIPGLAVAAAAAYFTYFAVQAAAGHDEIGGICGYAMGGDKFEKCLNTGTVRCIELEGGCILGRGNSATINNCFNSGELVGGDKHQCGSILGVAENNTKVTNCFSTFCLPIIGLTNGLHAASGNNYCPPTEKILYYTGYEGVPLEVLASGVVARWLNDGVENRDLEVKPWRQNLVAEGKKKIDAFPTILNHDEVTYDLIKKKVITRADELYDFSQKYYTAQANYGSPEYGRWFDCVQLGNDIDLSEYENFPPIGSYSHPYCGIFDGNGYTIRGLKVIVNNVTQPISTDNQGAGLFGNIGMHAEIRNLVVDENSVINTTADAGAAGIVGSVWKGGAGWNQPRQYGRVIIENCGSEAKINAPKHAGGILGRIREGEYAPSDPLWTDIINCYSTGTLTVSGGNSGMLCGYGQKHLRVNNCWSNMSLKSSNSNTPYDNHEFFAGYDQNYENGKTFIINNCYYTNFDIIFDDMPGGLKHLFPYEIERGVLANKLNANLSESSNGLWQQNLGTEDYPTFGSKGIYHARTVSNQYGTVCLPYLLKSDDNIQFYTFKAVDTEGDVVLKFEYTPEVQPGNPALFRVADFGEKEFLNNGTAEEWSEYARSTTSRPMQFQGVFAQKVFTETTEIPSNNIYYISKDQIRYAKKTTIAPFRAYIYGPDINDLTAAGAKSIQFVIEDEDGETTALEFVGNDLKPVQNGKTYSIMGTEVDENYRGIVIKNGKRYLKK